MPPVNHWLCRLIGGVALLMMPCCAAALRLALQLSSFPVDQSLEGHTVRFLVSGDILLIEEGNTVSTQLSVLADMSDLQAKIAPIIQTLGNRDEECGGHLRLHTVNLAPLDPFAEVFVASHYESWKCVDFLGRRVMKTRLFEQSASARIRLTPQIEGGQTITLQSDVTDLSAGGLLSILLKDNVLGPPLRKSLVNAIRATLGPLLRISLPAHLQGFNPVFERVRFVDLGDAKLGLKAEGRLELSADQIRRLLTDLGGK